MGLFKATNRSSKLGRPGAQHEAFRLGPKKAISFAGVLRAECRERARQCERRQRRVPAKLLQRQRQPPPDRAGPARPKCPPTVQESSCRRMPSPTETCRLPRSSTSMQTARTRKSNQTAGAFSGIKSDLCEALASACNPAMPGIQNGSGT